MHQESWAIWARTLQQKRLTGLAITMLEGSGPIRILVAQAMMGITPLINQTHESFWYSFAEMLEDTGECKSFVAYLLEVKDA
jgi:hypothetical protein